ncbi:hypothetical protein LQ938_01730 [Microbacterium sp. cx-55]|uniref:hypothetical protein n=1 Tax=Microbacterium sp. cx-55 TaxID=2875948 RepID=UPI001CBF9B3C|nr:hypothetical protein [Microbacterium sp. cx-55]UGB35545.1 hypothetical protein LQ938_01730 [Microbacterium sp. cx-55]
MKQGRRRSIGIWMVAAMAAVALSACTSAPVDSASASPVAPPTTASAAASSPASEPAESPDAEPVSAADAFRAWVATSRVPDAAAACAQLTPELAARMVAELNASGPFTVQSCEEMITATAELYRAAGQSADVDIEVQQETDTDATLFVTYLESGDCGTVVMTRSGTGWILTELSQECAA